MGEWCQQGKTAPNEVFLPKIPTSAKSGLCTQLKPAGDVKNVKFSFRRTLPAGCTVCSYNHHQERTSCRGRSPCALELHRKEGRPDDQGFSALPFRKRMKRVRKGRLKLEKETVALASV